MADANQKGRGTEVMGSPEGVMSCGFCSVTPVESCPICTPSAHSGQTKIRKAVKAPPASKYSPANRYVIKPSPPVSLIAHMGPVPTLSRTEQIAANDRRIAALQAALAVEDSSQRPTLKDCPIALVRPAQEPTPAPREAQVTIVSNADWAAAATFTRAVLRVPRLIESTCRVVTDRQIRKGDWAGLARAVDAGTLTEAAAIELAQSWKGVANG